MSGLTSTYMDLRGRGEGDVGRTIEIVPGVLLLDVDEDGVALGIEKVSDQPLGMADLYAVVLAARFASQNGGQAEEGPGRALGVAGAGSKAIKAAADFEETLRSVEATGA